MLIITTPYFTNHQSQTFFHPPPSLANLLLHVALYIPSNSQSGVASVSDRSWVRRLPPPSQAAPQVVVGQPSGSSGSPTPGGGTSPMVVDSVVQQAAPGGVAVVGPAGPVPVPPSVAVAVPPSVAVGKGVSSYSAAALSTLKRRLGAGNRSVGGKRHKVSCLEMTYFYFIKIMLIQS